MTECLCRSKIMHGSYKWIIMLEKSRRPDLNVFHLKWIIATHGNWKNQNPEGRFWATSPFTLEMGQIAVSSKMSPRILIFFNCHGCQTFMLAEIYCYLRALKSWHKNIFLSGVHGIAISCCVIGVHWRWGILTMVMEFLVEF